MLIGKLTEISYLGKVQGHSKIDGDKQKLTLKHSDNQCFISKVLHFHNFSYLNKANR